MARKGAMTKEPQKREKAMERLSPGVYRGADGGLVTRGGRAIRRPAPGAQLSQQVGQMTGQLAAGGGVNQQVGEMAGQLAAGGGPGQVAGQAFGQQIGQSLGGQMDTNAYAPKYGANFGSEFQTMPQQMQNWNSGNLPQMPQPSANQGGRYRLSPGVYGTREQAMRQYEQQMQQYQPAGGMVNYPGQYNPQDMGRLVGAVTGNAMPQQRRR